MPYIFRVGVNWIKLNEKRRHCFADQHVEVFESLIQYWQHGGVFFVQFDLIYEYTTASVAVTTVRLAKS